MYKKYTTSIFKLFCSSLEELFPRSLDIGQVQLNYVLSQSNTRLALSLCMLGLEISQISMHHNS